MIKKIICPFDFSPTAYNGAEYAAQLAAAMGAEILFMNMQRIIPVAAAVSMGEGIGQEAVADSREAIKKLEDLCGSVKKTFGVPADYEVSVTTSSFINSLVSADLTDAMIVMGTNGADTFYQALTGSHSYKTLKQSRCPVLIVPGNVVFRGISRVIIGWDYSEGEILGIIQLLDRLKPQYTIVHMEDGKREYNFKKIEEVLKEARDIIGEERIGAELLPKQDFAAGIDNYAGRINADLVALCCHSKGILSRFAAHRHTRPLSEKSRYPLLVLPSFDW